MTPQDIERGPLDPDSMSDAARVLMERGTPEQVVAMITAVEAIRESDTMRRLSKHLLDVTVTLDRAVKEHIRRARLAWKSLAPLFDPEYQRYVRRVEFGGNDYEAQRWPEQWQSAVCSAWLHDSCRTDEHDLGCTCTCHRKET